MQAVRPIFNHFRHCPRLFSSLNEQLSPQNKRPAIVLGIETSCDETGCAIVDSSGKILGECLNSQMQFHLRAGGINPPFAQEFHRENIELVVSNALAQANLTVADVDAIAVTNRPGMLLSLIIGLRYAKHLARKYSKPLIPIHHMEAHALMARLEHNAELKYPFLCLLASGGHCLLAAVKNTNEFYLLGEAADGAPGECFDKIARSIRLHTLSEYSNCHGGKAIEMAAYKATNPDRFPFPLPLQHERNCQFSFAGLKCSADRKIREMQQHAGLKADELIPFHEDFCAGLLKSMTKHMLHRTQRAIRYCERMAVFGMGPHKRSLVFSGGVACNDFIFTALSQMAKEFGYSCYRPSRRLCSDNGVMIAWNGIERWAVDENTYRDLNIDSVMAASKCSLGVNWIKQVEMKNIACDWAKVPIMRSNTMAPA